MAQKKSKGQQTAEELRRGLGHYQQALADERSRLLGKAKDSSTSLRARYEGQEFAFSIALTWLKTWTNGEFGTSLDEQEAEDAQAAEDGAL